MGKNKQSGKQFAKAILVNHKNKKGKLRQAINDALDIIADNVIADTPIDTGHLRSQWKTEWVSGYRKRLFNEVDYAMDIEHSYAGGMLRRNTLAAEVRQLLKNN